MDSRTLFNYTNNFQIKTVEHTNKMNGNRKYSIIAVLVFTILLCVVRGNVTYNISRMDVDNNKFKGKAENKHKFSQQLNNTETKLKKKEVILPVNINLDINVDVVDLVKFYTDLGERTIKNILNVIEDTLGSNKDKFKDGKPTENSRFISVMTDDELTAFYYHEYKDHIVYAEGAMSDHSCGKAGEWAHIKITRETGAAMCTLYRVKNLIKHGKAVCNVSYFSDDPNVYKCTCKERAIRDLNTVDNESKSCSPDIDLDYDAFAFYDTDGNLINNEISDSNLNTNEIENINEIINSFDYMVDTVVENVNSSTNIDYNKNEVTYVTPEDGGVWICIKAKNHLVSAYFHPTKFHYTRAVGKSDPGRSYADPGEWAISVTDRKDKGNKFFFNVSNCSGSDSCDKDINDDKIDHWMSGSNKLKHFSFFSIFMIFTSILIWQTQIIF